MITLGVLSDTHIPDRARRLHPGVLTCFEAARVDAILHAGDVSSPAVLDELARLAPVHAVRGNRDWLLLGGLPRAVTLTYEGVTIALTHGHGRWWDYFQDRFRILVRGYQLEFFLPRLLAGFPNAQVIVFGHVHRPMNRQVNGQLIFNPGSPHFTDHPSIPTSVGLLRLEAGQVRGEIIPLAPPPSSL